MSRNARWSAAVSFLNASAALDIVERISRGRRRLAGSRRAAIALLPGVSGDSLELGRVAALWRYPVKSMAGEALAEVEVSWHGLAGDRRWAFVRGDMVRSDFPWMTIRERSQMWHYRPSFTEPQHPESSRTLVATPAGEELEVADPALAAQLGDGVTLIKQGRGSFDAMPLSLLSAQSVTSLAQSAGVSLSAERFRPNLLVDTGGDGFPEEEWVGAVLVVGELLMRVDQRDKRCVIINVDPVTTLRDASILRTLARVRDACIGVYGSTVRPGRVAVGDAVRIVRAIDV